MQEELRVQPFVKDGQTGQIGIMFPPEGGRHNNSNTYICLYIVLLSLSSIKNSIQLLTLTK